MTSLLQWYASWVRANRETVSGIERFSHLLVMVATDQRNLIMKELAWTLVNLQTFTHNTIVETTNIVGQLRSNDYFIILSRIIPYVECLMELLLRRYCGHRAAWNVLLVLQSLKCTLNVLMHRQIFLLPWVWTSLRRQLRRVLRALQQMLSMGHRWKLPTNATQTDSTTRTMQWRERLLDGTGHKSAVVGPANTTLVIPRVVSRRSHYHCRSQEGGGRRSSVSGDNEDDESASCGAGRRVALPCTALDLLGVAVDFLLLLRPLLLLIYARRVFPYGRTDIATVPHPTTAMSTGATAGSHASLNTAGVAELKEDSFFVLHAALKDGPSRSLMSNWGVWFSFFGFDMLLSVIARYIRRHRVPVVFIKNEENTNSAIVIEGGEVPYRNGEGNNGCDNSNHNNSAMSGSNSVVANGDGMPPLLGLPVADVTVATPVTSRDTLRVQQALRNIGYSFLQDPFFSAVLQRFVYDHFVVGRINNIPLLGSLLAFQVSYFLCKQHYCYMYSIGQ